jgi:LmbE family N-acetylglucosaminyl deacetylase
VTSFYVAPHLDDIALSCAGGVLARARAGRRVVACTVFTKSGDVAIDRARAAEEATAMALVHAEHVELGFDDAPIRLGRPPSFRALALDAEVDPRTVRLVEAALAAEIERVRPTEVWFPLGIGGHIDHRTVYEASAAAGAKARFYEDRPYGFVRGFRAWRKLELEGGVLADAPDAATLASQLAAGGCAALAVTPDDLGSLARRLAHRRTPTGVRLRARTFRHAMATLPAAVEMIEAYGSQVTWLFGGEPARDVWMRLATRDGAWVEREVVVEAA